MSISKQKLQEIVQKIVQNRIDEILPRRLELGGYHTGLKHAYDNILDDVKSEPIGNTEEFLTLAVKALEKYGDMIVVDSEDHPHDVGQLARETLLEINRRTT